MRKMTPVTSSHNWCRHTAERTGRGCGQRPSRHLRCDFRPACLPGDPGHYSHLSPCGNLGHDIDFNSLRRYNDATPRGRRTVPRLEASKEQASMSEFRSPTFAAEIPHEGHLDGRRFRPDRAISQQTKQRISFGGLGISPQSNVLDVACGTGNTAIPAARIGAAVVGVDIATNLLEQAKKSAATEQLEIRFEEGDAEDLAVSRSIVRCRAEHVWSDVCAAAREGRGRVVASLQAGRNHRHGELDRPRLRGQVFSGHRPIWCRLLPFRRRFCGETKRWSRQRLGSGR